MSKVTVSAAFALYSVSCLAPAQSAQLSVSVLDENNNGVVSVIQLKNNSEQWTRFARTDNSGRVIRDYDCKQGEVLRAAPEDLGLYFISTEYDCVPQVTFRILRRQYAKSTAFTALSQQIIFQTPTEEKRYVVVTKGVVDTSSIEGMREPTTMSNVFSSTCDLVVQSNVSKDVYEIGKDNMWYKSNFLSNATIPVFRMATFNKNTCSPFGIDINNSKKLAIIDLGNVFEEVSQREKNLTRDAIKAIWEVTPAGISPQLDFNTSIPISPPLAKSP